MYLWRCLRVERLVGEMGSGGSKAHSGSSSSSSSSSSPSSSGRRRGRSKRSRVFQSSCFSTASRSCDSDNDDQVHHFLESCIYLLFGKCGFSFNLFEDSSFRFLSFGSLHDKNGCYFKTYSLFPTPF